MCQVAVLCISVFALPIVNAFGGGQKGWASFGALIGIVSTLLIWVAASGAKTHDVIDASIKKTKGKTTGKDISVLFKTKPLLLLIVAFGLSFLANTLLNSANMYYFKYVLHKENWIPTVMFVTMSASILASMVLPKLEAKFGKRNLFMYTSILCAIPLFIIGFMPTMGMVGLSVLLVVFGFLYGLVSALPWEWFLIVLILHNGSMGYSQMGYLPQHLPLFKNVQQLLEVFYQEITWICWIYRKSGTKCTSIADDYKFTFLHTGSIVRINDFGIVFL